MSNVGKFLRWLRQLTCSHYERSWTTMPITDTMTRTIGGCVRCGKWVSPGCERCGK